MLIIFGAPNTMKDDALSALAAAKEMLEEARRRRESGEFPELRIGIGLHRGVVVAATLGGRQRQEYTVIGDTVNVASRVQTLTRELDRPILLTQAARAALPDAELLELGRFKMKGKEGSIALFSPASELDATGS